MDDDVERFKQMMALRDKHDKVLDKELDDLMNDPEFADLKNSIDLNDIKDHDERIF
jgi:hypothetical protein